jgi:AcrR family transcriptional regulator
MPERNLKPGRPAAADRDDVLQAAVRRFRDGERIDMQALAREVGVGRTTIHRWFGTREDLIAEAMLVVAAPLLERARGKAGGSGGAALLDTLDRYNRSLTRGPALQAFLAAERDVALRIISASTGRVHPRTVAAITRIIEAEVAAGRYQPPIEPHKLAYALTRLGEAFLFTDVVDGRAADVDRLREVQAVMLGLRP